MPIYEYRCNSCRRRVSLFVRGFAELRVSCPDCGSTELNRLFSTFSVRAKSDQDVYKDILRITGEVAVEKGLDLVFESSEPDLSELSANELELVMGTHKLLYGGGCLDISDEVMTRADASK